MNITDTMDRSRWGQLARETPGRFDDEALELLGREERDDQATAMMLDIGLAASDDGSVDVATMDGCLQAYDVFLSRWQPRKAVENHLNGEHVTGQWQTISALCGLVLA